MVLREIKTFLTALTFFTRIPAPQLEFKQEYLNNASRYFSLIGIIVGSISFIPFILLTPYFSSTTCIIASLICSVLLTGAFHEDGLADMADGIGGGWTIEQKLAIMKDSRIGTYGSTALILLFTLKISLFAELVVIIDNTTLFFIFICIHSLSRTAAGSLILLLPYVQETDISKSKPVAQMSYSSFSLLLILGLAPLILFQSVMVATIIVPLLITIILLKSYLKRTLGGITGDCLGGAQQICELITMATFTLLLKSSTI